MRNISTSTTRAEPRGFLVFYAGDSAGIGHNVGSLAVAANYARQKGLLFHAVIDHSILNLGTRFGRDNFFSKVLDLSRGEYADTCLGIKAARKKLRTALWYNEKIAVIQNAKRQGANPVIENLFEPPEDVRLTHLGTNHLLKGLSIEEPVILVKSVNLLDMTTHLHQRLAPVAPFSDSFKKMVSKQFNFGNYIGVHVRHGNGEFLHKRPMPSSTRFSTVVGQTIDAVNQQRKKTGLETVLVFGDNTDAIQEVALGVNGLIPSIDYLKNERHQRHKRMTLKDKRLTIVLPAMRDLYLLSQSQVICSGETLFTSAALLWSKNKNVVWITA